MQTCKIIGHERHKNEKSLGIAKCPVNTIFQVVDYLVDILLSGFYMPQPAEKRNPILDVLEALGASLKKSRDLTWFDCIFLLL